MLEEMTGEALVAFGLVTFYCILASLVLCRFAITRQLLPNAVEARSSHTKSTSRAGGVAIMLAFLTGSALLLALAGQLTTDFGLLLLLSAAATMLGLADDVWSPDPALKFLGQVVLAVLATVFIGQLNTLPLPLVGVVPLGALGFLITVIWIVAFTNVFNFMDGLNGIAAGCALVALMATAFATFLSGQLGLAVLCMLAAASVLGFLFYNFPQGKIFLGDAGSHGLGFFLAVLAVSAGGIENSSGSIDAVFLPIVFLPFILDVTVTLINRALRGEKLHQAHKEHIYQRLHQSGMSHARVALIYMGLCTVSAVTAFVTLQLAPSLKFLGPLMLACFFLAAALAVLNGHAGEKDEVSGHTGD